MGIAHIIPMRPQQMVSHVLTFDKQPDILEPSLSATTDGKTVYYAQSDRQSVIRMMEISH
jgi:hypothetical protein